MKNSEYSISIFKKYLKKKGLLENKIQKKSINDIGSISRTLISSLIIVSVFFIAPIISNFAKKKTQYSKDFQNNSTNSIKKLLNNPKSNLDSGLNKKFVFEDVLNYEDLSVDTVRLSATTIEELFKSTNYSLEDVRKNKLVKPVSLTLLPSEIKDIENIKKRKNLFIQIILPLVIKENNNIKLDRKKLFRILNKSKNTKKEQK